MRRVRVFLVRLFLCVFFFLSFTHSSSHVLHDFELSSSSSFKSKFFLSCPSLFFFSRTCFENIECRKKVAKKKKKKKKKRWRREKGSTKGRFFFRTKFKSLVVVCGTLERRHGRRLVKKGTKKKRKEGRKE